MSNSSMGNNARRTGPPETIEPGVAHVEIAPGEPTETAGRSQLQVDDDPGQRASRAEGTPADRPSTGAAE